MDNFTRSTKILLGIASFWPPVYIFLFMAFVFGMIFSSPPLFGSWFAVLFVFHMLTIFLSLGLTVFYSIHAAKNEALKSELKIVWVVLFIFAGIVTFPIYWYLQIWNSPDDTDGPSRQLTAARFSTMDSEFTKEGAYQPPTEPPDWR